MAKIKEGDLVIVKPKAIKWFLDFGHECYYSAGKFQTNQYEQDLLAYLALAIGPEMPVKVNKVNWPNSDVENYNVQIFSITDNIDPEGVKLWQK